MRGRYVHLMADYYMNVRVAEQSRAGLPRALEIGDRDSEPDLR